MTLMSRLGEHCFRPSIFLIPLMVAWVGTSAGAQAGAGAQAPQGVQIGSVSAAPGTLVSGRIVIEPRGSDEGTFIPVTVAHGAQPGPRLSLIAGVHGSEYAPILALQRLRGLLDPAQLEGTVVLVHAANVPAFEGRTVYFGPIDRKNLNRSFPGRADGSITERIAHALVQEVIASSDYVMDIHAGDGNEGLRPSYTGYYAEAGSTEVIERSRRMAVAFGLDTILQFRGDLTVEKAIWCGSAAVALGIPSIDVESGERGLTSSEYVDPIVNGVLSVMRDLEMIEGEPRPSRKPFFVRERARVMSEGTGLWYADPRVRPGGLRHRRSASRGRQGLVRQSAAGGLCPGEWRSSHHARFTTRQCWRHAGGHCEIGLRPRSSAHERSIHRSVKRLRGYQDHVHRLPTRWTESQASICWRTRSAWFVRE